MSRERKEIINGILYIHTYIHRILIQYISHAQGTLNFLTNFAMAA